MSAPCMTKMKLMGRKDFDWCAESFGGCARALALALVFIIER